MREKSYHGLIRCLSSLVFQCLALVGPLGLLQAAAAMPNPGAEPPLESVTLTQAVQRARTLAATSLIASEEVKRAEALLLQARATALPTLGATGMFTHLDDDRFVGSNRAAAKNQQSANLSLSVPLVAPSRWGQWSHADALRDAARSSEADVQRAAALTAARAYLTVLAQRRVVEVSERARDTANAHFEFAQARRAGGIGNRLDELRAGQEVAVDEAHVELARAALARAREALGTAVGADGPLDAADEPALDATVADRAFAERRALAERADVRAARARLAVAADISGDSWLDWLPVLTASAQAFYQNPPSLVTPKTGWQAQLVLSVPLFEGGLRVGQKDERSSTHHTAELQLESLLRQARSEIRLAFEAVKRSEAAYQALRLAAERAKEALSLANSAYAAGSTTNLEVIDAERRARDAETGAIGAEDGVRQARLDLLAATAGFP